MTEIFFGTNRNGRPARKPKGFGKGFSAGLANLRFGKATVNNKAITLRTYSETLTRAGRIQRTDDAKSRYGSKEIFEELRDRMSREKTDAILFIHGYNVTFKEAIATSVKIGQNHQGVNGNKGVNVISFSWPSDGSMFPWIAYSNDRLDAAASGPAFARGLLKMADFFRNLSPEEACHQKLHLMAHSMGNYVLRHALQEVRRQNGGRIPRIFDQIFLFAPDEDDDAFEYEHKLKLLPRLGRHVNVYFNRGDAAMAISDVTKGNPDRLGDDGPRAPFQVPGKVSQIDCSNVVGGAVEHSYFVDERKVIEDIAQVMDGVDPKHVSNREYLDDRNRFVIV